ncbi:DUF748 domain-containing protein [Lacinutrix jangbogonensis]|uniref:DUF748 domain-containing protein n=1 Tax=Lacinutrix jangbogonensis TaxID=1469557 RepID=UPI00053EA52B|nr:DUF748 domain-containing protein [Lacinutrix jangbogonensis]
MTIIKKRTRNILLIVLGVILLILTFLPTFIKSYAINNSKELLGRQIDIGAIKYNYFSSTAKVYDFKMFEQNGTDEFTTFDTLIVNIEPYRLLFNEKVVEQFYIKGLMVNTVMQDSTFNFDDLIVFHSEPEDSITRKNRAPFKYSISNIELKDSKFFFDNKNVGRETHLEGLSFEIPHIGWDQEEKSNADVKFNFKNGGYFQSALNVNPADGAFDAQITIKDLELNPFYEYVLEYAEINDFNGRLNSEIKIEGNTSEASNSIVSGHVDVIDFMMTDKNNKAFLKASRIDCNLKNIDYANSSYVLDSLKFTEPYVYFEMDSITNNFFKIFKRDPNGDPINEGYNTKENADSISNLYYAINNLNVTEGIMDYSDNITGKRFDYHMNKIKMNSDGIDSKADWVTIYSDMLLNNRGTLNAKLGYNPLDLDNINLDLTIENFLLSDINAYSQYYMGHSILVGDFYYYSKSIISNADIVSENKLLVKNVEVINEKNGLFSLPLKFALFILKDKNGDVNLEIPVRGNINDPKISIGKIIWNTFKKRITGAATNPVSSLALLVDIDPKDYEELKFSYTDSIPSEKQLLKLDKLLEIETKKEGLKIELIHFVDPKLQRESIALSEVGKQYFKDTKKDYLKDKKAFEVYVRAKVSTDGITIKNATLQLIEPETTIAIANSINAALIKNTRAYLKSVKPATMISVNRVDIKEPENIGSLNSLKIKFDLKEAQSLQTDRSSSKK